MSLDKKKHDFITRQSRLQDNIVEAIQTHCDAMLEGLEDEDELNASSPAQQPHECVQNLISYLKSTFDMISFLPRAIQEVCQFTTCRHIAQFFQKILTEGEGPVSVVGIFNLNLDLLSLESFIEELDVADLVYE